MREGDGGGRKKVFGDKNRERAETRHLVEKERWMWLRLLLASTVWICQTASITLTLVSNLEF